MTLQHVISEIIGEESDEFGSTRREFQRVSDDEFRTEGALGLYELRDLAGVPWESADVSTVGGFITARFGHLPRQEEQIRVEDYSATVEQSDGRRIDQLLFRRQRVEAPSTPDGVGSIEDAED